MNEILQRLGLEIDLEDEKRKFVFRISHSLSNTENFNSLSIIRRHKIFSLFENKAARRMHSSDIADMFDDIPFNDALILYSCLLEAVKDTLQIHNDDTVLSDLYLYLKYLFKHILEESEVDLGYSIDISNGYIYRKGADELDKTLFEQTFDWLSSFPKAGQNYKTALEHYFKKEFRSCIGFAFDTIDSLVKKYLDKDSGTLDDNIVEVIRRLGLSNEWNAITKNYCKYAHRLMRHGGAADGEPIEVDEKEIEAYLYVTGVISRLLVRAINNT